MLPNVGLAPWLAPSRCPVILVISHLQSHFPFLYYLFLLHCNVRVSTVQCDLTLQVYFPALPTWDSVILTILAQVQLSCTSHRTRECTCRSSSSDNIIQRQPVPGHQSYFSPSTQYAEPVSPLVNIPPLSQTNPPPNLQILSPPVCSTGSQGANSALISCTMQYWHTPCLMVHGPSKVRAFIFFCVLKGR